MLDLTTLNKTNLDPNSENTVFVIQEKLQDIILHNDFREARILSDFLAKQLAENKYLSFKTEYQMFVKQLKFVYLHSLSDNEIISLYQRDFGKILAYYEYYLPFEGLRMVLISKFIEERDPFKQRITSALSNNQELITSHALFFTQGGESAPPSISNWIKDYNKTSGGNDFSNMTRANYFIKSENYLNLDEDEQDKVRALFDFYFRLQISSMTPKGYESDIVYTDPNGDVKILSEGQVLDEKSEPKSLPDYYLKTFRKQGELEEKKYKQRQKQTQELINILETEISQDTGGDFDKLIQELKQSVEIGAEEEVRAILRILNKQGKGDKVLGDEELIGELERMGVIDELGVKSEELEVVETGNPALSRAEGKKLETRDENYKSQYFDTAQHKITNNKKIPNPKSQNPKPKIDSSQKTTKQLMQEVLLGEQEEAAEINRLEAKFGLEAGNNVEKAVRDLRAEIKKSKNQDNTEEVVAKLRVLTRLGSGGLEKLLKPGIKLTTENFHKLINSILAKRLSLPESDAARYAMQLALILKKQGEAEFMKTVYFDKADGVFRWNV